MATMARTAPRTGRPPAEPATIFSIAEEVSLLKREPEWLFGKRSSMTVLNNERLGIVLVALRKDASICGHEVAGPITVQVLSGTIRFGARGQVRLVTAGAVVALEQLVAHELQAVEDSELLLTIIK